MTTSTTQSKSSSKLKIKWWTVLLWLVVWQAGSCIIGQEILLVSPIRVIKRLSELIITLPFWKSIAFSFLRIIGGFFIACISGTVLAALSYRFRIIRDIIAVPVAVIKATPVASFIILALVWISSRNLSIFIAFLMVFPIIYTNILSGIENTDIKLLEMTDIFRVPFLRKLRYIYLPAIMPFFRSSCAVGLGLCWKAGVAAEVIGISPGSIGAKLYDAKIYLNTPDLFAWTIMIIVVSISFEKLFMAVLERLIKKAERM